MMHTFPTVPEVACNPEPIQVLAWTAGGALVAVVGAVLFLIGGYKLVMMSEERKALGPQQRG